MVEVDAAGLHTTLLFFDLDDARAAQREAWARWAAIDPVAAPWVKLSQAIVTGFDAHDHDLNAFTDDVVARSPLSGS